MFLQRRLDHCQGKPKMLGFHNELLQLIAQQAGALRRTRGLGPSDDRTNARKYLKHSFVEQLRDDLVSSVGVDLERLTQAPHGREGFTGAHLTRHHGFLGGINDLLANRDAGLQNDPEGNHVCTMAGSTAKRKQKFSEIALAKRAGDKQRGDADIRECSLKFCEAP